MSPFAKIHPTRLFVNTRVYEKVPGSESQSPSPIFTPTFTPVIRSWRSRWFDRWRGPRFSLTRFTALLVAVLLVSLMLGTALYRRRHVRAPPPAERVPNAWESFDR